MVALSDASDTETQAPRRETTPLRYIDFAAEALVVAALLGELVLVLANVAARVFFASSFLWMDEIARLALSILAFIGGAVAYRRRDHAFVRVVLSRLPPNGERACLALAEVVVLFVAIITGYVSLEFLSSSWGEYTPIFQMPAGLIALPLPIGMALLALYAAIGLRRDHGMMALWMGAAFAVVVTIAALTRDVWLPWLGDDAAIIAALGLFSLRSWLAFPSASSCCCRLQPICGERARHHWWSCRKPWSMALVVSSCSPCLSSFWPAL